ncbi:MAG TPA: PHP domain-containing protein [Anaerolineae bacterium]|nr:PHP domain-containing protein [Anaerolineae bacterium]HOR00210.1 PHP domain-containing protein [Anaerolineae bacterium]
MRVDLHTHTHHSPDSLMAPPAIIAAALRHGLDAVAVTDHNSIEGALQVRAAAPFPVIVGEEVKTTEGEIIGLFLQRPIPPRLSPEETIAAIHEQGGLAYVPHPLDRWRGEAMGRRVLERIIAQVDAIEVFNARTLAARDNALARQIAEAHGLPMGAGSDAHTTYEIGRAYVEIDGFDDAASFLAALRHGRTAGVLTTPFIHGMTTLVKLCRPVAGRCVRARP